MNMFQDGWNMLITVCHVPKSVGTSSNQKKTDKVRQVRQHKSAKGFTESLVITSSHSSISSGYLQLKHKPPKYALIAVHNSSKDHAHRHRQQVQLPHWTLDRSAILYSPAQHGGTPSEAPDLSLSPWLHFHFLFLHRRR